MSRYQLPEDVKLAALSYVKGYHRRKAEYLKAYYDIMNSSSFPYEEDEVMGVDENGNPCKIKSLVPKTRVKGQNGDPTARKALELELLQRKPDTQKMRAVDRAMDLVGDRIRSEELREKLVEAIMLNCIDRRENTYEDLGLDGICRTDFYMERRRFLWYVAKFSDLLSDNY